MREYRRRWFNASPSAVRLAVAASCGVALSAPASATMVAAAPAPLIGLTPKEARADRIWALRAGLNVAALQCQFSPFLATVPTYNALLRQHSDEMADAFKVITGYFVRRQGPRVGQRAFDSYATRANQSWSTFDAQYTFCNAAAMVGRHALAVPKGSFGEFASTKLDLLRQSLALPAYSATLAPQLEWVIVPTLTDPCKGRRRCR